jgi:hypothetical protein
MKRIMAAALACAVSGLALQAQAAETDYSVLMFGNAAGHLKVVQAASGERCVDFDYNDRGRGPATHSCFATDAAGLQTSVSVTGVDYLKTKVDERFARRGGVATWSSASDAGSGRAPGFYFPSNAESEDVAALARALLKAPNHELDVLPGGHARLETIAQQSVSAGGETRKVTLYFIDGLAFAPAPVWLDDKGELFLEGDTWMLSVPKGWEATAAGLIKAQKQAISDRAFAEAKTLQHRPEHGLAIIHAKLFDPETRTLKPDTTVIVNGERILRVIPGPQVSGAPLDFPKEMEVVDAHGRTLMPGIFDMHVHIASDPDGTLDLINGITTVRDLGDDVDELLERRERFAKGELIGPRVLLGGLMDGTGPLHGPTKVLVGTPEEAHAAVRMYADHGYDQIKIYSSFPPELVPLVIADAHARGLRVSGHIPAGMTMSQAVEDGYDEVQHANFWVLNFLGADVNAKSNGMERFTEVGAHAKDLDLASPEVKGFVKLLQDHQTVVDPTLVAFEPMFVGAPRATTPALAPVAGRLPPLVGRSALGGQLWQTPAQQADYARSYARMKEFLKLLHDSGIRVVPGTDGMAGFELAHELETYVAAGIPAPEVLYLATLGSARVMKRGGELGSAEPGKAADLVLIDGDPTRDISDVRKVDWVMKGGTVYDPDALARSIGVKPRH